SEQENCSYEAILERYVIVTVFSSSNIYLVKDSKIYTHPATHAILHGCVRMQVEQFASDMNIPFVEEAFTVDDITDADELFLSSSTSEIMPIVEVDGNLIADGAPGSITKQLQGAYETDTGIIKQQV